MGDIDFRKNPHFQVNGLPVSNILIYTCIVLLNLLEIVLFLVFSKQTFLGHDAM